MDTVNGQQGWRHVRRCRLVRGGASQRRAPGWGQGFRPIGSGRYVALLHWVEPVREPRRLIV